jgi:NAD(P)-dependent dehydrogenase (short-subunit alcohol dehydrogenase family)
MKIDLAGKSAIVTGSTAGIGLAIALALAETGAEVVVNGRSQARVDEAMAHIRVRMPTARLRGVPGDLGTEQGIDSFVRVIPHADILVNNLGIFEQVDFLKTSDADWHRFFDINVMSGVRLTRHYLPGMVERAWGRVVFISSESALNIPPDMIAYGFTKAAQVAIARGIAESVPGTGVTVNSVLPGPTRTEGVMQMFEKAARESGRPVDEIVAEFIPAHRPTSLIRRLAEPEEIASMVAYVCSQQASATTGATLRVEGGLLRHPG